MYQVSKLFLQAVQENTRRYYWTGKITTKKGVVHEFGPEDIVKGSGYISSQCCGSTEIELGTVYASEMGITLFSKIDRYTLEDALVELTYHLRLADGSYEDVPMGIFEISEANRTVKCLEIKAYDYMLRFDQSFKGFESIGDAYDFMVLCSKACKVELAQTRDEIERMPNGSEILSIYEESDIETYRDVLYYVGQVLGGFFCINRYGKLELRKYGTEPVMEVWGKHRFSSSFSDFITRYTAVSSTNMRTETAEYYALDPDDGLTMNLGVNPFLQFGLKETREQLCRNILQDLSVIEYVPFDSETIGNPALDLGDVIRFLGGQADGDKVSAITSMQCKIGGKHSLKGVGKNPRLAQAKSKNDKNISGLLNQIEENKEAGKIGIHTFMNAVAYQVVDADTKIVSLQFATMEENHAQFFGQVIVDVTADSVEKTVVVKGTIDDSEVEFPVSIPEDGHADVIFTFEHNDEKFLLHQPQESWHTGKHTILLYYPIEKVVPDITNTFNVYMRVEGGSGLVDTGCCIASISGQSMGATAEWDGVIDLEEKIGVFAIGGGIGFTGFDYDMQFAFREIVNRSFADTFGKAVIGAFGEPIE